jgi:hypothetical protein
MKLSKTHIPGLIRVVVLFCVLGSFAWEILERLVAVAGLELSLAVGPYGVDLGVIAVYISPNPGLILGAGIGVLVFRNL